MDYPYDFLSSNILHNLSKGEKPSHEVRHLAAIKMRIDPSVQGLQPLHG